MSWLQIILFIASLLVMIVGMIGVILPVIPGVPIIFGAVLLFGAFTGFAYTTTQTLVIFAILTALSLILDWVCTMYGIKRMGGSWFGMLGSFIGMIIGLLIPGVGLIGFILGAFIGAVVFEMMIGKKSHQAYRAGFGSFIGFLAGGLLKFIIGAVMIGTFIWQTLARSF